MKTLKQDIDDRILLQETNEIAYTISAKMDAERPAWEPSNHSAANWASEANHPCDLFLTYCRLNWADRGIMDLEGRYRVQDGKRYEWMIRRDLEEIGYEVLHNQAAFRWAKFQISGKIDGQIAPYVGYQYKTLPFEIKTMGSFLFQKIARATHARELVENPIYWINKIPSQLNIYLLLMGQPAGLLILKTQGVKPKILPMLLDFDLADQNMERLIKINEHVAQKTYPAPMQYSKKICDRCDFKHLCLPVPTQESIDISLEIKGMLHEYWDTKPIVRRHVAIKKQLIGNQDEPGILHGKNLIIDDFEISSAKFKRGERWITRTSIDKATGTDLPW